MKLPNAGSAYVDGAKLRDYLVSSTHRQGCHKARAFARLQFDAATCERLAGELLRIGRCGNVSERVLTVYGTKYAVDASIAGPSGHARVRTVWLLERRTNVPRLLTACLLETETHERT